MDKTPEKLTNVPKAASVLPFPSNASEAPTVAAYALAMGLGTEAEGWLGVDATAVGGKRPAMSILIAPDGYAYQVPRGVRATDVAGGILGTIGATRLDALTSDHYDEAVEAGAEFGMEGERVAIALMAALTDRAIEDGWLDVDPCDLPNKARA